MLLSLNFTQNLVLIRLKIPFKMASTILCDMYLSLSFIFASVLPPSPPPRPLNGFEDAVIIFASDFDEEAVFPKRSSIKDGFSFHVLFWSVLDVTFVALVVNGLSLAFGFWLSSSDSNKSPNGSSMSTISKK